MSVDATKATWKLTKQQVTPTQKLLLLSYADRASESAESWPSNKRLEVDTGLDGHTICENKKKLLDKRLISYTGEKKGRTKSVDVIRLNYVHTREGYDLEFEYGSNGEMPTAKKISNGQMPIGSNGHLPIPKQWAFAHTETKRLNLKEEPTTTEPSPPHDTHSQQVSSSSKNFIFSEKLDGEILGYKTSSDKRSDNLFLKHVKHHIENNSDLKYSFYQRMQAIQKLLLKLKNNNQAFESVNYIDKEKINKQKANQEQIRKYNEYAGQIKSDIVLKLKPKSTKILSFNEWLLETAAL